MCAIVDTNVSGQVFGPPNVQTPAGRFFLDWLEDGRGKLVIGGELRRELEGYSQFRAWMRTASRRGNARVIDDALVEADTQSLQAQQVGLSNDKHVLALARVSGARLLFTNDRDLQRDFANRNIISGTRGRVYTTVEHSDIRRTHRDLLRRSDLCEI